jgi:hypothetical protein
VYVVPLFGVVPIQWSLLKKLENGIANILSVKESDGEQTEQKVVLNLFFL